MFTVIENDSEVEIYRETSQSFLGAYAIFVFIVIFIFAVKAVDRYDVLKIFVFFGLSTVGYFLLYRIIKIIRKGSKGFVLWKFNESELIVGSNNYIWGDISKITVSEKFDYKDIATANRCSINVQPSILFFFKDTSVSYNFLKTDQNGNQFLNVDIGRAQTKTIHSMLKKFIPPVIQLEYIGELRISATTNKASKNTDGEAAA